MSHQQKVTNQAETSHHGWSWSSKLFWRRLKFLILAKLVHICLIVQKHLHKEKLFRVFSMPVACERVWKQQCGDVDMLDSANVPILWHKVMAAAEKQQQQLATLTTMQKGECDKNKQWWQWMLVLENNNNTNDDDKRHTWQGHNRNALNELN